MKELNSHIIDEVSVHAEKQHEKKREYLGSFVKRPGHTIWEINLKTQAIKPAKFKEEYVTISGKVVRNLIKESNHWYCSALNINNAFKKFNKMAKIFLESKINTYDRNVPDRKFGG